MVTIFSRPSVAILSENIVKNNGFPTKTASQAEIFRVLRAKWRFSIGFSLNLESFLPKNPAQGKNFTLVPQNLRFFYPRFRTRVKILPYKGKKTLPRNTIEGFA